MSSPSGTESSALPARPSNALSPAAMLATSMHAQPGVYAVLIGSGVSTGAGIPTGWGIVEKLVRQLATATAAAEGQGDPPDETFDPERWWGDHHEKKLGYSSLLEAFPGTAATRQGLVARFIEPTDEERQENRKTPSRAHVALAQLVKHGFVKVVVTTNFDRLIEHALEAAGVSPQVIARPEACSGMNPLTHDRATVIKLNGDYKDLESLNTSEELSTYPEEWNTLLKQILDEYGLLISGWSADWDKALVALIEASPNRRYPLYWDSRSSSGEEAQRLLRLRHGQVVQASTADELFEGLLASVEALKKLSEPPLTTAMAVSQLKRYLPDSARHIDLYDLVMGYTQRAVEMITNQPAFIDKPSLGEDADDILRQDLVGTMSLAQLVATGVWHDTTGSHDQLWSEVLQRLAMVPPNRDFHIGHRAAAPIPSSPCAHRSGYSGGCSGAGLAAASPADTGRSLGPCSTKQDETGSTHAPGYKHPLRRPAPYDASLARACAGVLSRQPSSQSRPARDYA